MARPPPVQPDRFIAAINFGMETLRTEESTLRSISRSAHNPDPLIESYIQSRSQFYELLGMMMADLRGHDDDSHDDDEPIPRIHITVPANWNDAVPVVPTNEQLIHTLTAIPADVEPGACAICQDSIESHASGSRLRNCGHQFHTSCIQDWFRLSVRCPVCRNDIRETQEDTV